MYTVRVESIKARHEDYINPKAKMKSNCQSKLVLGGQRAHKINRKRDRGSLLHQRNKAIKRSNTATKVAGYR